MPAWGDHPRGPFKALYGAHRAAGGGVWCSPSLWCRLAVRSQARRQARKHAGRHAGRGAHTRTRAHGRTGARAQARRHAGGRARNMRGSQLHTQYWANMRDTQLHTQNVLGLFSECCWLIMGCRVLVLDDWGFVMDVRSDGIGDDVRGVVDYSGCALLEFWFEGDAECESAHSESECSGLVVGVKRVSCAGCVFRVCRSSFEWNLAMIADPGFLCSGCGLPCGVCWRVVPV